MTRHARALVFVGLLACVAWAQNKGFNLKAGESVRTSAGTASSAVASYGIDQYTFTRCLWASSGLASAGFNHSGLHSTGTWSLRVLDGGHGRWQQVNRSGSSVTSGSSPAHLLLLRTNTNMWLGDDAGLGGFTAWFRWGNEGLSGVDLYMLGVMQVPNTGAACTANGWGTSSNLMPTGILLSAPGDGGSVQICAWTDAGVAPCDTLGVPYVANTGYDLIISNAGGGSPVFAYTFTELDSGVSATGSLTNYDLRWMQPVYRVCNTSAVTTYPSMAVTCISTNW